MLFTTTTFVYCHNVASRAVRHNNIQCLTPCCRLDVACLTTTTTTTAAATTTTAKAHARTHKHTRTHADTYVRTHARTHTHTRARARAHAHTRTHSRTHARTRTHTHTHTHTHKQEGACARAQAGDNNQLKSGEKRTKYSAHGSAVTDVGGTDSVCTFF